MFEANRTPAILEPILDAIHAAALCPAEWDGVLRQLATLTGCVAGGLTLERPATRKGVPLTFFGFDPGHVSRSFDHYLPLNPLFEIESRMQTGFVVANGDVVAPETFRRSEFFNGWARPQGLCSPVTVVIHRTPEAYVPLTLVRPDGAGEVTEDGRALLSRLAPHLAHAMAVTVRLQQAGDGDGGVSTMLGMLPCGAGLLDGDGRVVFANPALDRLFDPAKAGPLRCVSGRIVLRDPVADEAFQAALAAALRRGPGGQARSGQVVLPSPDGGARVTVRLSPLPARDGAWTRKSAWTALRGDAAAQARCMVLFSMPDASGVAEEYGLTPAEARVLAALADGKGLAAVARRLGVSRSTVHSHLDRIFQKTGTNRQAELVGLVQAGVGTRAGWTA